VGTLIRWRIGKLNVKKPNFPPGTLLVNVMGSLIDGLVYILPRVYDVDIGTCNIAFALMNGFCGCLTTISTWVAELSILKNNYAYLYGFVSVAAAEVFFIIEFCVILNINQRKVLFNGCS